MSLEQIIKENTEVMRQLIAVMQGNKIALPAADITEQSPEESGLQPDTATLFDQARHLIMQLAASGARSKAVEILNEFGAHKLGQVPQARLAEVVMLAEKALARQ